MLVNLGTIEDLEKISKPGMTVREFFEMVENDEIGEVVDSPVEARKIELGLRIVDGKKK